METYKSKFLENYVKPEMEIIEVVNEGVLCGSGESISQDVYIKDFIDGGVFDTELH